MRWIKADKSVIICAPTSSGKTVLSSIVALIGKSKTPVGSGAVNEKRPAKKMLEAKGGDDDEISGDDEDDNDEDDEDIDGEDIDGEGEGDNDGDDDGGDEGGGGEGEAGNIGKLGKLSMSDETPGQGADTKHATIDYANKDRIARNEFR